MNEITEIEAQIQELLASLKSGQEPRLTSLLNRFESLARASPKHTELLLRFHEYQQASRKIVLEIYRRKTVTAGNDRKQLLLNRVSSASRTEAELRANTTKALHDALDLASVEVSKSIETIRELEASTDTLKRAGNEYGLMADLLSSSQLIIRSVARKDSTDRIILASGAAVFLTTISWIMYKRSFIWIPGGAYLWRAAARIFAVANRTMFGESDL